MIHIRLLEELLFTEVFSVLEGSNPLPLLSVFVVANHV
jgi:hypothetical protein